jgi:hypothetical protein
VVVIVRERGGDGVPAAFRSEVEATAFITRRVRKGTVVNADEASSWNDLHSQFEMKRVNHEQAHSYGGACTNWAEELFSVCVAPRSAIITISLATISCGTRKRRRGVKITAASTTAYKYIGSRGLR